MAATLIVDLEVRLSDRLTEAELLEVREAISSIVRERGSFVRAFIGQSKTV